MQTLKNNTNKGICKAEKDSQIQKTKFQLPKMRGNRRGEGTVRGMGLTVYYIKNTDFICVLGSKITADGDCSHEIKICLLLERKVMTNLESILKSRDITLPTKSI